MTSSTCSSVIAPRCTRRRSSAAIRRVIGAVGGSWCTVTGHPLADRPQVVLEQVQMHLVVLGLGPPAVAAPATHAVERLRVGAAEPDDVVANGKLPRYAVTVPLRPRA